MHNPFISPFKTFSNQNITKGENSYASYIINLDCFPPIPGCIQTRDVPVLSIYQCDSGYRP